MSRAAPSPRSAPFRALAAVALAASAPASVTGMDMGMCTGLIPKTSCTGPMTPIELLSHMPSDYDSSMRPPCGNATFSGPTIVQVQLKLTQINTINAKLGTIAINGYFRTWWHDPRLAFPGKSNGQGGCSDAISFPKGEWDGLWAPDTYVDNLVSQVVDGMEGLVQVYPDGSVWRSEQVLLTVKAKFDLAKLPYEEHVAKIIVASYSQDVTQLRVIAKGGSVGGATSGIGVVAVPMTSKIWDLGELVGEEGFETAGSVSVLSSWDYLTLSWPYSRDPGYFVSQVIVPSVLFMLISYMQFWVTSAAVPARAALAVIPVLIMRTMSNSIYASIPQGSQFMWLDLFVQLTTFMCVFAALHFGVVQALRVIEGKKQAKLDGLSKAKPTVEKLISLSTQQKQPLLKMLKTFAPIKRAFTAAELNATKESDKAEAAAMEDDEAKEDGAKEDGAKEDGAKDAEEQVVPARASTVQLTEGVEYTFRSEAAKQDGVTEADLLFIYYARDVFEKFDVDESNRVNVNEIRCLFKFFNIYMSTGQVVRVVGMFLRDTGHPSHVNEATNELNFSQFATLLIHITEYSLRITKFTSLVAYFQSMPASECWDVSARAIFPVLMVLQLVMMHAMLPLM